MSSMLLRFPEGFLWGASTSGHQVEGGSMDQWTVYEMSKADEWAAEAGPEKDLGNGRGVPAEIWPMIEAQAKDRNNYISGIACDHYNRFEEDLDLAKQLGLTAYRFSIEWSRIEPEPGVLNTEALNHYIDVIRACKARGIEPIVCLWHWCHPLWFEREGAWLSNCAAWYFTQYVQMVVRGLQGEGVRTWLVLNEPEVYALLGYGPKLAGMNPPPWPPQKGGWRNFNKVSKRLIECHKRGYEIIHEYVPGAKVSSAVNLSCNDAKGLIGRLAKLFVVNPGMWKFHKKTADWQDFVGLNYYMHQVIKGTKPFAGQDPEAWRSDMGWELYDEGLYRVLMQIKKRLPGKPVYITEHGLADFRDVSRARYIRKSLQACLAAIRDGVDLRGYLHWSLLDNFEWDKGLWARFGLIEVDRTTLERTIRPSAWEFAEIIAQNGLFLAA